MEADVKKLVEGYNKYTASDVNIQKTPGPLGMTISKSELKEPKDIDK